MIHTIPYKIPAPMLVNLEKGNYDKIILFALAVFGTHKIKEFINDPNESIENRIDKALFSQWADKLKGEQLIEEYELDDETYYRITSKGEEEVLNYPEVLNIKKMFEGYFGPIEKGKELSSKSVSGYKITYKDYIFGFLSLFWRLDSFLIEKEFERIGPDNTEVIFQKRFELEQDKYQILLDFAKTKDLLIAEVESEDII